MLLKTYRAPDLAAALAAARTEMGPHALVLATSDLKGRFGLEGVEVTVGAPRSEAVPKPQTMHDRPSAPPNADGRLDGAQPAAAREDRASGIKPVPILAAAVEALVASGLSVDLARRFAAIAARDLRGLAEHDDLVAAAERGMRGILAFSPAPIAAGCSFIVGPPGSGKTTTAAKIAARLSLVDRRDVIFAACDGERVGALEQAELFTRHLGVTLARVDEPDDLLRAMKDAGKHGIVVADTPGIGAMDRERLRFVAALRRAVPKAQVAVLLPSGLHRDEAERVLSRFAPLEPTCAALARVDDGARPGELVSALASTGIPLAFVTNGHRIPEDIAPASARSVSAILLRAGREGASRQEGHA